MQRILILYPLIVLFGLLQFVLSAQGKINLEDIFEKNVFYTKAIQDFRFLSDGIHYTRKEKGVIKKYNINTGDWVEDIFDGNNFLNVTNFNLRFEDYAFSPSEKKILITVDHEKIFRHSFDSYVFMYDINSKQLTPVFPDQKIANPSFSPNEKMIAFTFENNLHYYDLSSGKIIRITSDGEKNKKIHGLYDWVYEEEFGKTKAYEWSPSGDYLGFISFDESDVPEFTLDYYEDDFYPVKQTFKYPKVGQKNAHVSVQIYDVQKNLVLPVPINEGSDFYIPRINWKNNPEQLIVTTLNRHQNHMKWHAYQPSTNQLHLFYEEKNKYYIDIQDDHVFLKDGKQFVILSEREGFNQLYLQNVGNADSKKLTPGNYDVQSVYGLDEKTGTLYFKASMNSPIESEIYTLNLKDGKIKKISSEKGSYSAQFSPGFQVYVLNKSTLNSPPSSDLFDKNHKKIRSLENNQALLDKQKDYTLSSLEFFTFQNSSGVELNGWMCKPQSFDPNKKYPVFMTQYSGPGSQSVVDKWQNNNYWWYQMLAQNGYIVVCVDGRGTGNRGEEFKKMTYLKLGHYETIDQIDAAKYLSSLSYVDPMRIGIFGWSYGGYMSTLCLLKGNETFKSAIAVAPVTNWKWYDSVYTERYMRTVEENPDGYANNSPVYFADKLKGNYLLIHGMADDNVHFQHAAEMANQLIKHKKQFDTYFYPNRNHSIYGDNARIHLFTKVTQFIYDKI